MMGSSIPTTYGKLIFVDYDRGSDGNSGDDADHALKTIPVAYARARTNRDDVLVLSTRSAHPLTEMLTVAKSRVHFVGIDGTNRVVQQGAKIELGVTTEATDLAPILVTGTRNSFIGTKVINNNTKAESLYGFISNGEATYFDNFSSMVIGNLGRTGHAHFWMSGDSDCGNITVGQSNTPSSAAGYGILIDGKAGGGSGGVVKENFFQSVRINMSVANGVVATSAFIKIADNAAMNFNNSIEYLSAHNYQPVGASAMTDAVLAAASTVSGKLDIGTARFFGCTGVGAGSGYGVYIAAASLAPDANGGLAIELSD